MMPHTLPAMALSMAKHSSVNTLSAGQQVQ